METTDLEFIIHHLFLLKRLPQHYDITPHMEEIFVQRVLESARKFAEYLKSEQLPFVLHVSNAWKVVAHMLQSFESLHARGTLRGGFLAQAIDQMSTGNVIPLHIQAQNAGVILRRPEQGLITFECFQASPKAEAVASNAGKLVMQFPYKPRTSMPFRDDCINSLSELLSTLDTTEMEDAIPKTRKAQKENKETRDVADIRYVSELVGGIIGGLTDDIQEVANTTIYTTKRIGDHVLWSSAELPWRRTPKWLILRVSLQTTLRELGIDDDSPFGYKSFVEFLLSQALQLAIPRQDIPDHVIHEMMCKIATRLQKLSQTISALDRKPFQFIHSVLTEGRARLDSHWVAFQEAHANPLNWSPPSNDDVLKALRCDIITGKDHMDQVIRRPISLAQSIDGFDPAPFEAACLAQIPSRSTSIDRSPPLPLDLSMSDGNLWIAVLDVERWISKGNLTGGWFEITSIEERVDYLVPLIHQYLKLSLRFKEKNPELFSRLFLTMFELWTALDRTVIEDIPILGDYSPEFNLEAFTALLLPDRSQMTRLAALERYLAPRLISSHYDVSIFTFQNNTRSFAHRYFRSSDYLHELQKKIVEKAECDRQRKRDDLASQREEYNDLNRRAGRVTHEYQTSTDKWGINETRHTWWRCTKCSLENQAANLTINVFEWPLPEDEVLSAQVVFELNAPSTFTRWRDITWMLSRRFDPNFSPPEDDPHHELSTYSELQPFSSLHPSQNLTIASRSAKSHLVSHYATTKYPCSEDAVIKNHPLRYEMYSTLDHEWLVGVAPSVTIRSFCAPKIPKSKYSNLGWTISDTTHTSNQVMAKQSTCHADLLIHDYLSASHLRSGHHLQYHNIALGILNSNNLGDEFSFLMYRQALWQAESASETGAVEREAHLTMRDRLFGEEMLVLLRNRLGSSKENWQQSWVLTILSCVACRLVQLTEDDGVRNSALVFLTELREVIGLLIPRVLEILRRSAEPESHKQHRLRLVQLAVTCRSTFGVGTHVQSVLHDAEALHHFVYTSVLLADNTSGGSASFSHPLRYLIESDVVLSANLLPFLRHHLTQGPYPFDESIRKVWDGYVRGSEPWRVVGDRWATCSTSSDSGRKFRSVHLNLLDGTLRVDGKALDTLPSEIVQHPLYRSLFPGQDIVEIAPSTMNGMDYELRHPLRTTQACSTLCKECKPQVHFRLQSSHLIIRLRQANKAESEFIPPDLFAGDLPKSILDASILLFHDETCEIDIFSSRASGWTADAQPDWILDFGKTGHLSRFKDGSELALSPRSSAVAAISTSLSSLEQSPSQLLVLLSSKVYSTLPHRQYHAKQLLVDLPRYRLSFYVAPDGSLFSRQFPNFKIGASQSIGTLIGLKSRLVLEYGTQRCVILPLVPSSLHVHWRKGQIAPIVTLVPPETMRNVSTCIVDIDPLLQRLSPQDSTVRTWYYVALLHLLSSSPLPDPLTGESGIQRALRMLSRSKSISFSELDPESITILKWIAECSPVRQFYPKHLQCMEKVEWDDGRPPFIQDDRLTSLVRTIFEHDEDLRLFSPSRPTSRDVEFLNQSQEILVQRASHRYSRLFPTDEPASIKDIVHSMQPETAMSEDEIASLARVVIQWKPCNSGYLDFWELYSSWQKFSPLPVPSVSLTKFSVWFKDTIQAAWFSLLDLAHRESVTRAERFSLAFTLSVLAFRAGLGLSAAQSLLLILVHSDENGVHTALEILPRSDLDLSYNPDLTIEDVSDWVNKSCCTMNEWSDPPDRTYGETYTAYHERLSESYHRQRKDEVERTINFIWTRWRSPDLDITGFPSSFKIVRPAILDLATRNFRMRYLVGELRTHARRLHHHILPHFSQAPFSLSLASHPTFGLLKAKYSHPSLVSIMLISTPSLCQQIDYSAVTSPPARRKSRFTEPLHDLVAQLDAQPGTATLRDYCQSLKQSIASLEQTPPPPSSPHVYQTFNDVTLSINPTSLDQYALLLANLWPSSSPISLLKELTLACRNQLPPVWLEALSEFARSLLHRQRTIRLSKLTSLERATELMNPIPARALSDIDWLLIQLDSNFSIRPLQASIAERIMHPEEKNMVTQLNMGEGKTSVITPVASAALALGTTLVHVVVLKPLVDQSLHLLRERLSNLANRPIFIMPFSRDVSMTTENAAKIESLFRRCQEAGGILLAQPEHILSLHLMAVSYLCTSTHGDTSPLSQSLLKIQIWLQRHSRLILDESDELLKVKYTLIYTLGASCNLTGQPRRWEIIQDVLSILAEVAPTFHAEQGEPAALELRETSQDGQFPPLRLLEKSSSVVRCMFEKVVSKVLPILSLRTFTPQDERLLLDYITDPTISEAAECTLIEICGSSFHHILLLRGLFAHGLLKHVFADKRYRVDYGLHSSRTALAVPYRSKDQPAQRAEFGHPDIILLLTLLSYYYTGLTHAQLLLTFEILYKSDNPVGRYEDWIKPVINQLPESVRTLNGLNLEDESHTTDLFPKLACSKTVIDFYVGQVVFPKTREFKASSASSIFQMHQYRLYFIQHKLTTSAWDLADQGDHAVTGFSGTKDNRYLLPTPIKQDESQDQLSTTAIQLADLLQTQNDTVISTGVASAKELLKRLVALQLPSLLFDVGAQILELDNRELAELWLLLETRPQYEAVVYFDPVQDEPFVLHRDGLTEKFSGSLYRTQLDKCLVYLDEAHTRGTDFKFPPRAVAVVTLGPRLTKDKFVQGCMRLRQLAASQRIIFFCPAEVCSKVSQSSGKLPSSQLSLLDVVTWTIFETCNELQTNMPLWRQQGLNYIARKTAWDGYQNRSLTADEAASVFREPEAQSLETLYGVARNPKPSAVPLDHPDFIAIQQKCQNFDISVTRESTSMMEEQERELAHEKETEREVQRPPAAPPFTHSLDRAVYTFLHTGKASTSWSTLAECLQRTLFFADIPDGLLTSRRILATKDFRDTIQLACKTSDGVDDFIRPVRWLLSSSNSDVLVLISPFEANILVPEVRQSTTGFLHLYSPRDMRNTETLEALDFLTLPRKRPSAIPQQSIHELNLFAGQLFFTNEATYHDVCQLLGLYLPSNIPDACKGKVDSDGFVADSDARRILKLDECKLKESPIPFLQQLIAARRKGQGFTMTHVGKMVYGRHLDKDEFVN
ncbi:hypothetical protein DL96DRAFT_1491613 [Flagelloscypha sp. PMI_526]|nr:hypothetical protein DL96DRAFT_1491613 [Flagelloscypha sp. PMI_526]